MTGLEFAAQVAARTGVWGGKDSSAGVGTTGRSIKNCATNATVGNALRGVPSVGNALRGVPYAPTERHGGRSLQSRGIMCAVTSGTPRRAFPTVALHYVRSRR